MLFSFYSGVYFRDLPSVPTRRSGSVMLRDSRLCQLTDSTGAKDPCIIGQFRAWVACTSVGHSLGMPAVTWGRRVFGCIRSNCKWEIYGQLFYQRIQAGS